METIPRGLVEPQDIRVDLFLQDCEQSYCSHQQIGDDYPFVTAAFHGIPWMEAIMGCPIRSSPTSFWAEPVVADWQTWHWEARTLDNPWAEKLLELVRALVEHSQGRYSVAPTLMRGPSDMLAALRGAKQLPLDLLDFPDLMRRAIDLCAEVWIDVGKAQLGLIPSCDEGYVAGDYGLKTWAPDKVIWLQEDAMALLSPQLYREFFLAVDRRIADQFCCSAFHLHDSGLWAVKELAQVPEIDVLELNFEATARDEEGTFAGWKEIQVSKPLVVWRLYEDDFWSWLARVLTELSWRGLSIQTTVRDVSEGKRVKERFLEVLSGWRNQVATAEQKQ